MNIFFEPEVYFVGQSSTNEDEIDRFLVDESVAGWQTDTEIGGEKLIEIGGRLCYQSFAKPRPGGNKAYIDHLLEVGHGSCLEHATFNFIFTRISRSLTHELIRSRAGFGYSQRSQRFVDESNSDFVCPPYLKEEVKLAEELIEELQKDGMAYGFDFGWNALDIMEMVKNGDFNEHSNSKFKVKEENKLKTILGLNWISSIENSQNYYKTLSDYLFGKMNDIADKTLRRKRAREAARSVLPNATETKIFVTGNARAVRHLIEMRGDNSADAEIRELALKLAKVCKKAAPNIFTDYEIINNELCYKYKKV